MSDIQRWGELNLCSVQEKSPKREHNYCNMTCIKGTRLKEEVGIQALWMVESEKKMHSSWFFSQTIFTLNKQKICFHIISGLLSLDILKITRIVSLFKEFWINECMTGTSSNICHHFLVHMTWSFVRLTERAKLKTVSAKVQSKVTKQKGHSLPYFQEFLGLKR